MIVLKNVTKHEETCPGSARGPRARRPAGRGGGEAVSGEPHHLQSHGAALGGRLRGVQLQGDLDLGNCDNLKGKDSEHHPADSEPRLRQDAAAAAGHGRGGGGGQGGSQLLRLGLAEGDRTTF